MGVRRAVELVMDVPGKHVNPIYTFGPLIHNPQVLELLKEKGISILNDIPSHGTGTVLIRAHGVPPQTMEKIREAGFNLIDATCPRVIKVQTIIQKYANQDYASIIIGDKNHPEVAGLLGYSNGKGYVADSIEEFNRLGVFDKAIVVAQTTQNIVFFNNIKKWVENKHPSYKIFNTICDSTEKRQTEVTRLSKAVDATLIVGGRNSGNTKRLAEIARQTNKPAYHIETEADLTEPDIKALASARTVGITAGASTPNWIIKRVYRSLENLSFRKSRGWRKVFFTLQRTLLLTNIYVSLGAGCLCYACTKLQGITNLLPYVIISILYVQSMHILNHLTGSKADKFNDPERAFFYKKHKPFLTFLALVSGGAGLLTAYTLGWLSFLVLLTMSIMGLSYNLKLLPERLKRMRYQRVRDIPGSKTLLIATAWGIVTSLIPSISDFSRISFSTVLIFMWATGMVFVRSAFFDTLDIQGDRIVGKETIPILLGEKKTIRLLKVLLISILIILLVSELFNPVAGLGSALTICPVFMYIVIKNYEKRALMPGIRLEFLVETLFIMAGLITFLYTMFQNHFY